MRDATRAAMVWAILSGMLEDRDVKNDKIGAYLRDSWEALDAERSDALKAYSGGLSAAALIAERTRDARSQMGDEAGAALAERIRVRIEEAKVTA